MFVMKENGSMVPMQAAPFALEEDFQRLLELHPELLAGELINAEAPRRWMLVAREFAFPGETEGAAWRSADPGEAEGAGWRSADQLFLDQDGIPTIVEVKRQTDTMLRREAVGQMLDYAANALGYLPAADLRSSFERSCKSRGADPDREIQARLGRGMDAERFWLQVKTNLEAQRIRLLFVADAIPRELRRVVEFLNRQLNPAEMLALELRQFVGEDGLRTLVPTLYGQTEEARGAKSAAPSRLWSEDSVFENLRMRQPELIVQTARKIADWVNEHADQITFGQGNIDGSMSAIFLYKGEKLNPIMVSTAGKLYINFGYCKHGPFAGEAKRMEWRDRLKQGGLFLTPDCIDKYPGVPLSVFTAEERMGNFLQVMDWFRDELKKASA